MSKLNLLFKEKPHLILWLFASVFNIFYGVNFLKGNDSTIDVNIHDTYYVIAQVHLYMAIGFLFLILGFGYFILRVFKVKLYFWLTIFHIVVSLLSLCLLLLQFNFINFLDSPTRYYQNTAFPAQLNLLGFFLFVLAQITYFVNIVISMFTKIFRRGF